MRKCVALGVGIAAVMAAPAYAEDPAGSAEFFAGPIIGYDNVTLDDSVASASEDGVMYGLVGGVDYQFNNAFFAGIEAEYSDSDTSDSVYDVLSPGDSVSLLADRQIYVGARIGMRFDEGSKVYLKAGYANAKLKGVYDDGMLAVSDTLNAGGFLLGAGADYRVSGHLMLRGEYRYSHFNAIEIAGYNTGIDATRHQVVGGILYGF